ncbi:MAG TPA: hypothetical protein DDZ96_01435 [Porphyromonadaceae bacterium]|jgi:hypothetical protein|uniref:DUF4251 domain-containing protein n=1 Tax=Limibacterium fermenti TaxID=3229863 RepID=UPI000E9AA01A|nr:hypothetical protein [Porphyromonadaceae bacterium]HBK30902.1 hypothetical protein [Porphyromonadaceae bacterium]HBL32467.1 hypothetical protein [Porphyromonadaceae bacterium]HBX46037.1 hypothetical protein [Porphyromonadaceae bacterium]HCM20042.1 hypothetical protein [Porphyromonadaceae bacterium]
MKKNILRFMVAMALVSVLYACGASQTAAEKAARTTELKEAIEARRFTFNATYVYPTGFKSRYLTPSYDVKVSPDTLTVYLPYYGRAYSAPIDPGEGGIKFSSTDFSYEMEEGKKAGNWQIRIRTNDTPRQTILFFDIWENAKARLDVTHPDRQPISFQGDIVIPEKL